jgi:AAA+ ATPase superfamily predicted ATPase
LERLHLIEKEVPATETKPEKSRKGLYRISDNFFRFWFQFVYPYKSELQIGRREEILDRYKERSSSLEAVVYESVCCELLLGFEKKIFSFDRIGRWWEQETEIDIVALNIKKRQIIFGECKWSSKPVGTNIYNTLRKKAANVQWERGKRKEYFILFSKSGFTEDMVVVAKKEKVFLVHGNRVV